MTVPRPRRIKVMKEIDFLPEWYKSSRRKQVSCRVQLAGLGVVLAVLVGWSFISTRSVSTALAKYAELSPRQAEAEAVSREFAETKGQVNKLREKLNILQKGKAVSWIRYA